MLFLFKAMSKRALKVLGFMLEGVCSEPRLWTGLLLVGLSRLLHGISLLKFFRSFPMEVITIMSVRYSHSIGLTQQAAFPPRAVSNTSQTVVAMDLLEEKRCYFF